MSIILNKSLLTNPKKFVPILSEYTLPSRIFTKNLFKDIEFLKDDETVDQHQSLDDIQNADIKKITNKYNRVLEFKKEDFTEDNYYMQMFYMFNNDFTARDVLVKAYSWAIPNEEVLREINKFAPKIMEIGSGIGYWSYLLKNRGSDIICCENHDYKNEGYYMWNNQVELCDNLKFMKKHKDENRAIMICWHHDDGGILNYLNEMKDSCKTLKIIYIGEGSTGCTGELLKNLKYKIISEKSIHMLNYEGISDFCLLMEIAVDEKYQIKELREFEKEQIEEIENLEKEKSIEKNNIEEKYKKEIDEFEYKYSRKLEEIEYKYNSMLYCFNIKKNDEQKTIEEEKRKIAEKKRIEEEKRKSEEWIVVTRKHKL